MTSEPEAAELLAAVRAVESGERSAASFFAETATSGLAAGSAREKNTSTPSGSSRPGPSAEPVPSTAPGAADPAVSKAVRATLTAGGAPGSLAGPVLATLGGQAEEQLRGDPWQLLLVPGVLPEQADSFARTLLESESEPGDERRVQALLAWLLERAARRGHTVLEPDTLCEGLSRHAVPQPEEAVRRAADSGTLLFFEDDLDQLDSGTASERRTSGPQDDGAETDGAETDERPVRVLAGLERYALAEESLAEGLARLIGTRAVGRATREVDAARWEAAATQADTGSAAELIRAAAGHALAVHTGGESARAEPAALVAAARALGLRAYAATHSEDGRRHAARMIDAAGGERTATAEVPDLAEDSTATDTSDSPAVTVAGLRSGREGPGLDAEGAYALDLLAVLDAPQLDTETGAALVEGLPDGARLVLSGDPQVLGSAGPGQVLQDVRASGCCPRVTSRTPDPGPLGELVSGVGVGELLSVRAPDREVVIVPVRDPADAVRRTVQLVTDSVPRAVGVPADLTQVITPGHGGEAGTRALNTALKEALNPGPGRFGGFDRGDRVAYSPAPRHTVTGYVRDAGDEGLRLELAGRTVVVAPQQVAATVRHGWAVTAHQATGTRWPAVITVLPEEAADTLTRDWVYTAFGRAEQHLSVVQGVRDALPRAVASATAAERTTRLRTLLVRDVAQITAGSVEGAKTAEGT